MSTYEQQQKMITQEAYMEILKKGIQPLITRVQTLATRIKGEKILGVPFFDPKTIYEDETSDATQWNKQLNEILWDLTTVFNETKSQGQRLMALSVYFSHERDRLNRLIKELNLKCQILEERLENPEVKGFSDSFTNFDFVETLGNTAVGLSATTAMIDLKRGSVRLPRLPGIPGKHDMVQAEIRVKGNGDIEQYGKPESVLMDAINDTWQCVLKTKEEASLEVEVIFKEAIKINTIELEYENIGNCEVKIDIGDRANEISLGDFIAWEMEPVVVDKVTLTFTKKVPDFAGGSIFSIRHICFKYEQFQNSARLITKTFPIDRIEQILLKADEVVPPQTNIRYYLSLEYENQPFDWVELIKNEAYSFNNIEEEFGLFSFNDEFYGAQAVREFEVDYYAIGTIDRLPFANSMKLMFGERMWLVESTELPETATEAKYIPSVADWKMVTKPSKMVVDIDRMALPLPEGKLHKLTTYIYCLADVVPAPVRPDINNSGKYTLYINNAQIQPVSGKLPLKFSQGWNKIEVMVAAYNTGTEFRHKLPLDVVSDTIFADYKSMRLVSLHELTGNTSLDNNSKFALLKKDNKYLVVVNFNPVSLDMYKQGCRFQYSYKYLETDANLKGFRMMTVLERSKLAKELSCHLLGYQLLVK